jgi:16S rRNA (cytosine1402-N4)-methyltransferase
MAQKKRRNSSQTGSSAEPGTPRSPDTSVHSPVLLAEVLKALAPVEGDVIVDGTFGAGGYTRAILDAANCTAFGIDRDPEAMARGAVLSAEYPNRLALLQGPFSEMEDLLDGAGVEKVHGVVLDLGVSSPQLDQAERGFSFRFDGPLDMRMSSAGQSAEDVVNGFGLDELTQIIRNFGEERHARRVAKAIVAARDENPITRTLQLADLVSEAMPPVRYKKGQPVSRIHPATRTFQALRIFVNDEIGELRRGLLAAERLLGEGGRLVVVSFHSLEDREVKNFMKARSGFAPRPHRHSPAAEITGPAASFDLLKRGVTKPTEEEEQSNPRARSARLRAARRTSAPVWNMEDAA